MVQQRRYKILIVDDNPGIRSFLKPALEEEGYHCLEAADYYGAIYMVENEAPDVIVLDIDFGPLSKENGLDVCKTLRDKGIKVPVIFLTRRDRLDYPDEMMRAYSMVDTEYMNMREELLRLNRGPSPKSDVAELKARIKAALRIPESVLEFDNYLKIDLYGEQVHLNNDGSWTQVHLSPQETSVLMYLVRNQGKYFRTNMLASATYTGTGALDTCIYKLRTKIEPDWKIEITSSQEEPEFDTEETATKERPSRVPRYIIGLRRKGYSFDPQGGK